MVVRLESTPPAPLLDQVTPALLLSPETDAVRLKVPFGRIVADAPESETEMFFPEFPPPPQAASVIRSEMQRKSGSLRVRTGSP